MWPKLQRTVDRLERGRDEESKVTEWAQKGGRNHKPDGQLRLWVGGFAAGPLAGDDRFALRAAVDERNMHAAWGKATFHLHAVCRLLQLLCRLPVASLVPSFVSCFSCLFGASLLLRVSSTSHL